MVVAALVVHLVALGIRHIELPAVIQNGCHRQRFQLPQYLLRLGNIHGGFEEGGAGGGIARDEETLKEIVAQGVELSPVGEVLIEESIEGWKS